MPPYQQQMTSVTVLAIALFTKLPQRAIRRARISLLEQRAGMLTFIRGSKSKEKRLKFFLFL
ncbi:hypothetical protein POPTR_001G124150v4 [Populus trichocarpa]|uniref:Uncharacterized protein n=1 Tax=Populus trichocarpa TaxID=3694 RepID=A0ACC0TJ65_POPTR|nr:hypothetical protein POPTR_001G124150v4 [Populus trichocarpa]